ncbi:TcpE family conjugal transfer membrane protein [Planomonospora parontospora]|uniref:TcpE family conjugal transfer membrane protein n=1 Tax=Planomonospora parontospora TaxID=58119 RepID=UPI00166F679E|nr:TcpE family conjugal transfer membrane protein [Planomonospora parontospora]GGL10797.1 hypothetical protein GCM10014719_10910 [Planomonospora parontospora subsp. antibiotica]GII14804.1 hypothetical protein Ppa05_15300 [Planomonospora parontospora subsp. antibiotica]
MDLPTYTNIWRIEKRLYKLYDLRLPMPLPIVWIGVFVGVTAPWSFLLAMLGLPFDAPWHVVYLVPPGVVTWLSTRPVIEGKRLTELLQSQSRYLGEPRTWCRMAPAAEPSEITLVGRVWRTLPQQAAPVRVKVARRARHAAPSRRAAEASRTVRPAVAAAAAAAATAPVTGDRVAWGTVAAPRRGTAPALGRPVPSTGTAPAAVPTASAPSAPSASAASAASAASPAPSAPSSPSEAPVRPAVPVAAASSVPAPVPAPEQAEAPATAPAPEQAPATPIDTEALRRLRRLAASAEAERAEPAAPPGPAPSTASGLPAPPAGPGGSRGRPSVPRIMPRFVGPAQTGRPRDVRPAESEEAVGPGNVRPAESGEAQARSVRAVPERAEDARAVPEPVEDVRAVPERVEDVRARRSGREPREGGRRSGDEWKSWPQERSAIVPGGVSIRAVPAGPAAAQATPAAPAPAAPAAPPGQAEPKVRRVESVIGRDSEGGWRRLAQVVMGPGSGSRTDGSEVDEARARGVFSGSRRVVVLGCTGGAGQTTTALMLGHTLARLRDDRVLAVDASTGAHALSGRVRGESPETLSSLLAGLDGVQGYLGMRAYTSRCASGLEVLGSDTDAGAEQRLSDRGLFSDRRLGQAMDLLDRHYKLVVVDPAAALAARVLPYADQLILVAPASEDGADAVAMTYEWLDGHGCTDLRRRAIMVVNGVSRRSMADVEQAEAVARGRCRAIVRVPWEDELAPGRSERVEPSHLRAPGRRAYLALAGVVVAGLGAMRTNRTSEEELAQ